MTAEKLGVPTVPIITDTFENAVKRAVFAKGMANIRFTFIPHPVAYRPAEECREKILGDDPVNGKRILTEIIEALTKPLTDEEKKTGSLERPRERLVSPPDTPDNLQALFRDNGWTLYLPVILPTEEKVAEMLNLDPR